MMQREVTIQLANGMEASPVAVLVQIASQYDSTVYLKSEGKRVNAKSIMGMMSLGLDVGEKLIIEADGNDEGEAIIQLEKFLSGK